MVRHKWIHWVIGLALCAGLALTALSAAPVAAGGRPLKVTLTGEAERPGPGDPDGSGSARFELNQGQKRICYRISVSNIGTPTAAHIHKAPPTDPGPVVVPLSPPVDGLVEACAENVDPDLIRAIRQHPEEYYVNVHNADFPAGAVRGQLGK
jgi:hypothetical protein